MTRQRLLEAPLVFLKSHKEAQAAPSVEPGLSDSLLTDLEILSATARRADRRLRQGLLRNGRTLCAGEERCWIRAREQRF